MNKIPDPKPFITYPTKNSHQKLLIYNSLDGPIKKSEMLNMTNAMNIHTLFGAFWTTIPVPYAPMT